MNKVFLKSKYIILYILSFLIFCLIISYFIFRNELALWAYGNTLNRNGELLKDFLSIIGGILVIIGLYLSFIRAKSFEKSVEKQEQQILNQTKGIELTRSSLINEQFKNAISHLGENKEPIILGGIAELNEIADKNDNFRELICDILSSFIRSEAHYNNTRINNTLVNFALEKLTSNIFKNFKKNLSNTNLSSLGIKQQNLTNFIFDDSKFFGFITSSNLYNCSIKNCQVSKGKYAHAQFINSSLQGAFFEDSVFEFCSFNDFLRIKIIDCNFYNCTVEEGIRESILLFNDFTDSRFGTSSLGDYYTFIQSSNFSGTQFNKCDFSNAKIEGNIFDACLLNEVQFKRYVGKNSMKGAYSIKISNSLNKLIIKHRLGKKAEINSLKIKESYYSMLNKTIFDEDSADKLISEYNILIDDFSEQKSKYLNSVVKVVDK